MKNKKTLKINFLNWGWDINDNFLTNHIKKFYNIEISGHPDYLFFSLTPPSKGTGLRKLALGMPYLRKKITIVWQKICSIPIIDRAVYSFFQEKLEMPVIKTRAKRIFYTAENSRPDMNNCEYAFTFDYDEELKNPRHLRLPYYKFSEEESKPTSSLIKKNMDFKKIKKEKTKFCAFVYSKNVPFRNKFFKELSKYKKVDAPGNSMRNMPPFGEQAGKKERFIPSIEKKMWQKEKLDFLKQYKFVIAFENSSYPGYTTEKIYHPMLVNSIPIYWGNRKIYRDFNTKSFLNYYDFEDREKQKISPALLKLPIIRKIVQRFMIEPRTMRALVRRIVEIDKNDNLYEQYIKEPWLPNNKPTKYISDEEIDKQLKIIFENHGQKI